MSKERPILFSAPMVRAILEGSKTQTRRIVKGKPQPWEGKDSLQECKSVEVDGTGHGFVFWKNGFGDAEFTKKVYPDGGWQCPYGKPGDRLWVRETWWAPRDDVRGEYKREYIKYAATLDGMGQPTWKPSIHMPRWASRITLEVVSVRVERLQDIGEQDAKAEGVMWYQDMSNAEVFQTLWESINGPGSWEANPWVWCISFKRIQP